MKTQLQRLTTTAVSIAFFYFTTPAFAQQPLTKLEVKKKETYVVGPDNTLKVDTLIMHDKAAIEFAPGKYGVLEAKVAIIGDKCLITSKGAAGKKGTDVAPGGDGGKGGNLSIIINFESLGQLTIDTRGGDGGPGVNGKNGHRGTPERVETRTVKDANGKMQTITVVIPGEPGSNGTDATMGGNGGNGGNLMLMYRTKDFIPVFNQETRNTHSIVILHTAGQRGRTGEPGKGGLASTDGAVRYTDVHHSYDGQIDLINMNKQTLQTSNEY